MRILIAEDDKVSRNFLFKLLSPYGECDMVIDGLETLDAFLLGLKENKSYDLLCLDIMMPKVNGIKVLRAIRDLEIKQRVPTNNRLKVIMTTALAETAMVQEAFDIGCEAYIEKPIDSKMLIEKIKEMGLM